MGRGSRMVGWPKGKRPKAQRTIIDGIAFPSKLEAAVYGVLKLRVLSGELRDVRLQHRIELEDKIGRQNWKVDFSATVVATGEIVWVEAKGNLKDRRYIRNRSLWRKDGPGVLEIWSGSYKNPEQVDTILPKNATTPKRN